MQTDTSMNVGYVAELARLKLSPDQVTRFTDQLHHILVYMEKLTKVDTTSVSEAEVLHVGENNLRHDAVADSFLSSQALQNAPGRTGELFSVPKIVE